MPELRDYLAALDTDPADSRALAALEQLGAALGEPGVASALAHARKQLRDRGELETVARLFDAEIAAVDDQGRRADLWFEKGQLLADDLLNEESAVACFQRVLELRPDDEQARELIEQIDLERENWQKFVQKYLDEAQVATDRQLTTSLYLSAAEISARYEPTTGEAQTYLRKALEVDPRNRRAAQHLERLLRRRERWAELAELLEQRASAAQSSDERVQALLNLAELAQARLERPELAAEAMKQVIATEPAHPRALRVLADLYELQEDWPALVAMYESALKSRRQSSGREHELGMLLQIAMLHWRRLGNPEAAEEWFRRIRKTEPAHPAALDFYRQYYLERGEVPKLLQILRQAQKSAPASDVDGRRALTIEIAETAEHQLGNAEKAIDAWKAILRAEAGTEHAATARAALRRLYRKTEKWNGLLDMVKDDIERLPADDVAGRVEGLMEVVGIYRDRLHLGGMVVNSYNAILKLDPHNRQALDDLAARYEESGHWNELIGVLSRKAELPQLPVAERVELLRRIGSLWSERFGNHAQAIKPLEQLLEYCPNDAGAIAALKEIYTRRRQWRGLIGLLAREAEFLAPGERRDKVAEMARLAAERLGDNRLSIELWNRVLELPDCGDDAQALAALAYLYEREKRYLALVEVYRRQRHIADSDAEAVKILERLGGVLADKLDAPALAAEALREVLELRPDSGRALRTLRELYAAAGDFDALESLYGQLGQWDELVDALLAIADRLEDRGSKIAVLERAARCAAERQQNLDKTARAYERILSVDPRHLHAARALVPVYEKTEKWARLLSTYEILLTHASDDDERLELILGIRNLCETRISSKANAFQWTARAYQLRPDDPQILADLERLGAEADQWDEVAAILDRRVHVEGIGEAEKLRLLRELGRISLSRLHLPERARDYHRQVLAHSPDDRDAMAALEDIATQLSEWPDLLAVYRHRVDLEDDQRAKLALLFKVAFIEEERVADLDAAVATYQRILQLDATSGRALRALSKLQEARGDWQGMAEVLERELAMARDDDAKVALLMRLGGLYENNLERPAAALERYLGASKLAGRSARVHAALERFLDVDGPAATLPLERRVEVARVLLPVFEEAELHEKIAAALEVERLAASDASERLELDRRLAREYGHELGRPGEAFAAARRVLQVDPEDEEIRRELAQWADALGNHQELAAELSTAQETARQQGAPPAVLRAIAAELAVVYDERVGDVEAAELAWLAVLELEPSDAAAYAALERLYRADGRWSELRDLLLRREQNTLDGEQRKAILLQLCELEEGVLDHPEGAIAAYRRVLDIDPASERAFKALERLYEAKQRFGELEALLAREQDHVEGAAHIELTYRRAALRAHQLGDPSSAVDLLEDVVRGHRGHADARELLEELLPTPALRLRIARILEPLYEGEGLWRDLGLVLRVQSELANSPHEAAELLARVATIEEESMDHARGAFDTWTAAMTTLPAHEGARGAVRRLAGSLDRWPEAATAYETALAGIDPGEVGLRAELLTELASIYDLHVADAEQAKQAYRRLLEVDRHDPHTARVAATALARLYEEDQDWAALVDILRLKAGAAEDPDERQELLVRVAVLHEESLQDPEAAVATWREVLADDPEERRALDALERLHLASGRFSELIEILRRRVELATDNQERKAHLERIARLYEQELGDSSEAVTAHLEVLDQLPDDASTMRELARLYRGAERHTDLLEILERQLSVTEEPAARVELELEVGILLAEQLGRSGVALERFAEVLRLEPEHPSALVLVEAMLESEPQRLRAAEILQPLYETGEHHDKLASLLLRVADAVDDPREKLRALRQVASLREAFQGDRAGAFAAMERAVRGAAAEPELPELLDHLERLAFDLGDRSLLIAVYRELAPQVLDADLQRRLFLTIAALARTERGDALLAKEYYRKVLDAQPDDLEALVALEELHREADEHGALHAVLMRKAELIEDDLDKRAAALMEAARLCTAELGRPDDAIVAWEQVLEIAPENQEAARSLEKLYERAGRWHDVVELLERRLGFAFSVDEAVKLRVRLGKIHEEQLHNPDGAVDNYSAALGGDPGNHVATAALERYLDEPGTRTLAAEVLEPIYVAHQDWPKLVRIYEIKLEGAVEPDEKLQLLRYIARLTEEQLEDLEGAARWYGKVFREDPTDEGVRDQLTRLATVLEDWQSLANVYQEFLDDVSGGGSEVREVALALAHLYERRLDEVELALAAYRRVLEIAPDDMGVFADLEAMLRRAERWYALVEVYEDAARTTMDDRRRIELLTRTAEVREQHLNDINAAIDAHRTVLDIDPGAQHAASELDRLFSDQSRWDELAELLTTRIERADSAAEENRLRLRLADLLEKRLSDTSGAIEHYEVVLRAEVGWEAALPPLERLVVEEEVRERIAELLEPVYRANDWWQKLVVILDAQLQYVEDPTRRVEMLREIATLHETRGGDEQLALDALARAWRANVADSEVYDELSVLAAKLGAWDALIETLEGGVEELYDYELVAAIVARIAELHESQRDDAAAAIAAWRRVLEINAEDGEALAALDRLLSREGRAEELSAIVERRAELADDPAQRLALRHRVAAIYEAELGRIPEAISAYKNVLAADDADAIALDALDRLYRQQQSWPELAATLVRKLELATEPPRRRELRFAAAEVYDQQLADAYEAIAQLRAILEEEPGDEEGLTALDRIYQREAMWPELLEILDRRAANAEGASRTELGYRAAHVVQTELMEPEEAIGRYAAVLELDSQHRGTREALDQLARREDTLAPAAAVLEELYRAEASYEALAELYERKLGYPTLDPTERKQQYRALAELQEGARGNAEAASEVWARALRETPEDRDLQRELERLAGSRGAWQELADLYEARLRDIVDAELEFVYASKLAGIYEDALGDLDRAATKHRQALAVAADEGPTLAALDRIYGRASRYEELAEILAREADATLDESQQAELLFRLGDVRETQLDDVTGAVAAYRDVLDRAPEHSGARESLERLLGGAEEQRAEIVSVLEPLYEAEGDFARLADLLTAKLSITDDALDRSTIYMRMAELAEHKLGDELRALDAAGGWLAEDPLSEQALAEVERLAAAVGRWGDVAARLEGIIGSADSIDVRQPLLVKLGMVQLDHLGADEAAEATFGQVLELDAESVVALEALQRIYRQRGDEPALAATLWRRGELAFDADKKRACFVEVGQLRETLGDVAGAIEAWREVLALEENDTQAHQHLAALYERGEQYRELIEVLETAARFAGSGDEERQLRVRIARLWSDQLESLDDAVDAWQAVLDAASDDPAAQTDALLALESVHRRRHDWLAVQEVLVRRMEVSAASRDKIAILSELAAVAHQHRESVDEAIGYLLQILDLDNAHAASYAALESLLAGAGRHHEVARLLERRAEVHALQRDTDGEIECLARAADVWEGPLADPEAAGELLEKILARQPRYVPALTRLARIYEAAGDWQRAGEVLQQALAMNPTGRAAAELYYRLGEVTRRESGDLEQARRYWQRALQDDAMHLPAISALEEIARDHGEWETVADMLRRREALAEDEGQKLDIALELAELYRRKLNRPHEVIELLERAAALDPNAGRVLAPLADLYFAVGRHGDATPLYERLADEAKSTRKMKDVARYRQRLGGIFEAAGDADKALSAYEEAFRVNPTDVETMAGLGRIYMARQDWEKARRVYRSMVLQDIDPELGLSKADVYFHLGRIHAALGEDRKAKGMYQRGLEIEPSHGELKAALEAMD